jgi:osmoprotectant transport system substrate-binding protein/osmoprotectant transport system permease protein
VTRLIAFWLSHRAELASLLGQHVLLVAASTFAAVTLGVPLGVFAAKRPRLAAPLMAAASIVQTIPSLAMFGFLLPVPLVGGVGARAALFVLVLYGLLPIVRTTIAGLRGIDASIREAGVAMGMTPRELLRQVELPLALPSIVAGVRVAAVVGVGSATIAAAIGAGGLGEYIYRGLSMVDTTVILAGAVPAAALALVVDGALLWLEKQLSARRRSQSRRAVATVVSVVAGVVLLSSAAAARRPSGAIIVGSKNFTEQLVLGELLAQTIEHDAGLPVDRRLNLGGTLICDRALITGDIDLYVEYTGTALTAVFHQPVSRDSSAVFDTVRTLYAKTGRALLPPLGFNNTFAILVRGADARSKGLRTIDDAARESPRWRAGFGYEFVERPDGYPGLAAAYGFRFPDPPRVMDLTLSYRALASGQVDLIAGDATAGLIKGLDLAQLDDTRHYFPPYDAAVVARADTLLRHPEMRAALDRLSGRISAADMRAMNYAADVEHRDVPVIVREFLGGLR